MNYKSVVYKNIRVYSHPHLDGGGSTFGQTFIPAVRKLFGKVNRICEFASGPGFIGFSLLAHGLCDSLCLIDVNAEAIAAAKYTVAKNGLRRKVNCYISNGLKNVPAEERWDLVVSYPPFFHGTENQRKMNLLKYDPGFNIHKMFYGMVGQFLLDGGQVLFAESHEGSRPKQWREIVEDGGLRHCGNFEYSDLILGVKESHIESLRDLISVYPARQGLFKGQLIRLTKCSLYYVLSRRRTCGG